MPDPAITEALDLPADAGLLAVAEAVASRTSHFDLPEDPPRSHVRYLWYVVESMLGAILDGHAHFDYLAYRTGRDGGWWGADDDDALVEVATNLGLPRPSKDRFMGYDFDAIDRLRRQLQDHTKAIALDVLLSFEREGKLKRGDPV